jgi:hypothetical protein
MGRSGGRNATEVEKIVVDFERSGLNRREYCERRGIARPTLDWYRRRVRASRSSANFVPVKIKRAPSPAAARAIGDEDNGFALVLGERTPHRDRLELRRRQTGAADPDRRSAA